MATYCVEISLPHPGDGFFIKGTDLEDVLAQAREEISRAGVVIHLDSAIGDGDDDDDAGGDNIEAVSVAWNPFQKFEHSVS